MNREYESFVRANLDALYGYARFLTGNEHDAWDVVQEALTRMGLRWSRIDVGHNPVGYARTAIARLTVDRHRVTARERPTETLPEQATTGDGSASESTHGALDLGTGEWTPVPQVADAGTLLAACQIPAVGCGVDRVGVRDLGRRDRASRPHR